MVRSEAQISRLQVDDAGREVDDLVESRAVTEESRDGEKRRENEKARRGHPLGARAEQSRGFQRASFPDP